MFILKVSIEIEDSKGCLVFKINNNKKISGNIDEGIIIKIVEKLRRSIEESIYTKIDE